MRFNFHQPKLLYVVAAAFCYTFHKSKTREVFLEYTKNRVFMFSQNQTKNKRKERKESKREKAEREGKIIPPFFRAKIR